MSLSNERLKICRLLGEYCKTEEQALDIIERINYQDAQFIKDRDAKLKHRIVENDIYTADEIFRIIDEVTKEEAGEELI